MNIEPTLSKEILEAFPILVDATFLRQFASPVPLVPDTLFNIFITKTGQSIALVRTDYPAPSYQSRELERVSLRYKFDHLIKPYSRTSEIVKILDDEDMDVDFFINEEDTHLRYYAANLETTGGR